MRYYPENGVKLVVFDLYASCNKQPDPQIQIPMSKW